MEHRRDPTVYTGAENMVAMSFIKTCHIPCCIAVSCSAKSMRRIYHFSPADVIATQMIRTVGKDVMQGWKRRLTYVVSFEVLAIAISSSFLSMMSGSSTAHSAALSVMISTTAMILNLIYNYIFEAWEQRQSDPTRTVTRRIIHAIGFQLCLITLLIPMISWWFDVSLLEALIMNFALTIFFPIFTFVFSWGFDTIFGPPQAAPVEN